MKVWCSTLCKYNFFNIKGVLVIFLYRNFKTKIFLFEIFGTFVCDVIRVHCGKAEKRENIQTSREEESNEIQWLDVSLSYIMQHVDWIISIKRWEKFLYFFPKRQVGIKAWYIYYRRSYFKLTENHRLCSDHFSKTQSDPDYLKARWERDKHYLRQYRDEGALPRLKCDAAPDVFPNSLLSGKASEDKTAKPCGAFWYHQEIEKADVSNLINNKPILTFYYDVIWSNRWSLNIIRIAK